MPTHDLYSKRQKIIRGEVPEVFQYENFPQPFRVQVMYILMDLFPVPEKKREEYFKRIHDILCREYGLSKLNQTHLVGYKDIVQCFLLSCEDIEVLDIVECSFKYYDNIRQDELYELTESLGGIDTHPRMREMERRISSRKFNDAISEINKRFLEHGIGYSSGQQY